jgi:hypothetical protein
MFYGEYVDDATTPLFPFGHGLSYTSFSYTGLVVDAHDTRSPVVLDLDVSNVGDCSGDEVVQLYVNDVVASVARPERQLVGVARVRIAPGETCHVRFEVHPSRLGFVGEGMLRVTEPGDFRFVVGASSTDERAGMSVSLAGETCGYDLAGVVPTVVSVTRGEARAGQDLPSGAQTVLT